MNWCYDRYKDVEYLNIFEALKGEGVRIHVLKKAIKSPTNADVVLKMLKKDCKVKGGMAMCLIDDFKEWIKSKENE